MINENNDKKSIRESDDLKHDYLFAKDIKEANINTYQNIVINNSDLEYDYLFDSEINDYIREKHVSQLMAIFDKNYKKR